MHIENSDPQEDLNALRKTPLFRQLSQKILKEILSSTVVFSCGKGEYVHREGEPSRGFYVVRTGCINVHRIGEDGTERVIRIVHSGETFSEASLLPVAVYPASARAETQARLLLVAHKEFLKLIGQEPSLACAMIAALSSRIHHLVGDLDGLRGRSASGKLRQWLVSRGPADPRITGYTIKLDVSKSTLAAELGIRPETLSRALSAMDKKGLIQRDGHNIHILNRKQL